MLSAHAGKTEAILALIHDMKAVSGHAFSQKLAKVEGEITRLTTALEVVRLAQPDIDNPLRWRQYGLTVRESEVMQALAKANGQSRTCERILAVVYADKSVDEWPAEKIIDVYVCKIRNKLLDHNAPYWIETVWNSGYSLHEGSQPETDYMTKNGKVFWHRPAVGYKPVSNRRNTPEDIAKRLRAQAMAA